MYSIENYKDYTVYALNGISAYTALSVLANQPSCK